MTKMAATPIYGKNLKKIIFPRTQRPMILKLGMQHWRIKVYKVYINDDPGLTLTYFRARSNLVTYAFEWWKLTNSFKVKVKNCKWLNWQKIYVFGENLISVGCLPLPWGYKHIHAFRLTRSAYSIPMLCRRRPQCSNISSETAWPIKAKFHVETHCEGGTKVYINSSGHMTKMAAMPIYGKNL